MVNTQFKYFSKNKQGRDFVVGDLHGMFSIFEVLLDKLNFNAKIDRVFSVGDLIDRGPESYRVLEFLEKPWFFSIKGNHEMMLLSAKTNTSIYQSWTEKYGGAWWEDVNHNQQEAIFQHLKQLPVLFEITCQMGNIGIAHADVPVGLSWQNIVKSIQHDEEIQNYIMWSGNRVKYLELTKETIAVEGIDLVVLGHTPVPKPLHIENLFYIDTGATYLQEVDLGRLTILQIHPTIEVHQYPEPL